MEVFINQIRKIKVPKEELSKTELSLLLIIFIT